MSNNKKYIKNLSEQIKKLHLRKLDDFFLVLLNAYKNKQKIYICGNGGSAANANHISNDFMLGINKKKIGLPIISLSTNVAQLTCIANDINFSKIFSNQIHALCTKNDILIILSGSGNSPNIIEAIKAGYKKKMIIFGMLGFNGGLAKKLLKDYIHFNTNDMQVCEDLQMICANYLMKKFISISY
jgi:D-sedoheptulose 7-phosphate isomerase